MADLNELLLRARAHREQSDANGRALATETARLGNLREQLAGLGRKVSPHDGQQDERIAQLRAAIAASEAKVAGIRRDKRASADEWTGISALLEPLLDPRRAIAALDADYPILLFPVRLETRFTSAAGPTGAIRQLLVRIYPDDCLIDSFEPDLSENEVKNLRRYWCGIWAAGGDQAREQSAWRELCAAHGAGRAMYLIEQYKPLAQSDPAPVRSSPAAMILAVCADAPLANAVEKSSLAAYWSATWRAGKNATALAAALQALTLAVGAVRAEELRTTYQPFNSQDPPAAGADRAVVPVSTVFLVLPAVAIAATKRQAWTRPPQAALLPERFVLIADSGPEHIEVLGGLVQQPLAVGPDPLAEKSEQFQQADGDLIMPDQLLWMSDFAAALKAGMAFRVDLSARQAAEGFDRLYVLGVRLNPDPQQSRQDFEQLLAHHAGGQSGFAIVPQGTATNNSEQGSTGWTRVQEADELFPLSRMAAAGQQQFDDNATAPYAKTDGLHLAEVLGIDAAVLQAVPNADGRDQAQARAMNTALFPATLGYWLDTQLLPAFGAETIARIRRHFVERVSGRGPVPVVRIGKQPYGIVATTAYSRMTWMDAIDDGGEFGTAPHSKDRQFLMTLRDILRTIARQYWDKLALNAPRVGRRSEKPQQQLLDIMGLHPSSVEFHLQILDSADRIWNEYKLGSKRRAVLEASMRAKMQATSQVLKDLGYAGREPEITAKFFSEVAGPMTRPVIDVPPLSETAELTLCTPDSKNYLTWCREKARSAFEDLRLQRGFSEGKTPNALLYHVLRHALQLGYHSTAFDLHEAHELLTTDRFTAYKEPQFVHVAEATGTESRYGMLYARQPVITGSANSTVAEFIPKWLSTLGQNSTLAAQIEALAVLEHASTAALERAFAEHIDLCSYRWDAWMLSLVNERLHRMRRPSGDAGARRQGLYLGAFGWVENLKPDQGQRSAVQLSEAQAAVFNKPGQPPLFRDAANAGHVLAPSLNHAGTAAVLRNGYVANATPAQPDLLAIDLSSARVRIAIQFMEGMRNGQPLGALLGYQFERRLHDRHNEAEVDRFIYQVRKAFPLASKHLAETASAEADNAAIEAVEARNVCDGLLLIEHVRTSAIKTYPWGKALEPASATQRAIIDEEVLNLFQIHDAISDVSISEAVHQLMVGNTDRAAAAMDATSKGSFPPEPDVVRTPRSGIALTHRVALHLPVDAVAAAGANVRGVVEPAIDRWLETIFPPMADIVVHVEFRNGAPGSALVPADVTMHDLGLGPVDLLYILDFGSDQAMGEFDDRIVHHIITTRGLSPDGSVLIRYTEPGGVKKSAFEVAPLAASLRSILLNARPLRPTDAAMPNEADRSADAGVAIAPAQVSAARTAVAQIRTDATALRALIDPLALPASAFAAVVGAVDALSASFVDLQHRAALAGVALSSPGSILRARSEWFQQVRAAAVNLADRWSAKLAACDALLAEAVNPANSDQMKLDAIERAEREVSTSYTDPIPATPALYLPIVQARRATFAASLGAVQAVSTSAAVDIQTLWNAWSATFPGRAAIDLALDTAAAQEDQVRALVSSMQSLTSSLITELAQRIAKADKMIADAATATGEAQVQLLTDAVKALLGDGARIIPRFTLSADHGDEWQNAFDGRGALLAHLLPARDFPVDDWMYGIARVRPKLHDWENVVLLTGAFGTAEPSLAPVQFPFNAAEPWLAMELPAAFELNKSGDHLLYTAAYPGGVFNKNAPQFGGLLIDEWTEVIPATQETAGLAFNFDRPSNEPPQSMLLVTPASSGRQWTWDDLKLAVPETFDMAKKRAVEPRDISATPLSRLLPATLMAFTTNAMSISSELRVADILIAEKRANLNG
ncbi:hypothetical protein KY495_00195 [Massilia sp. PAMC28688]|uniref:hypothetical protein n=1 Tax=Massilia sp. PAMC28688 TaxID=2861283 RepID=UPI001C629447|nr:hypothetical protein [Massilia sp. PAMC28688]QYF93701.1 hypothetical protein KY495_00195 [Massilia sp. PAMC28688]